MKTKQPKKEWHPLRVFLFPTFWVTAIVGVLLIVPHFFLEDAEFADPQWCSLTYKFGVGTADERFSAHMVDVTRASFRRSRGHNRGNWKPDGYVGDLQLRYVVDPKSGSTTSSVEITWQPTPEALAEGLVSDEIVDDLVRQAAAYVQEHEDMTFLAKIAPDAFSSANPPAGAATVTITTPIKDPNAAIKRWHKAVAYLAEAGVLLIVLSQIRAAFFMWTHRPRWLLRRPGRPSDWRRRETAGRFLSGFSHPVARFPLLLGASLLAVGLVMATVLVQTLGDRLKQHNFFVHINRMNDEYVFSDFWKMHDTSPQRAMNLMGSGVGHVNFICPVERTLFSQMTTISVDEIDFRNMVSGSNAPQLDDAAKNELVHRAARFTADALGIDLPRLPETPKLGSRYTRIETTISARAWGERLLIVAVIGAQLGMLGTLFGLIAGGLIGVMRTRTARDPAACKVCGYTLLDFQTVCPECGTPPVSPLKKRP